MTASERLARWCDEVERRHRPYMPLPGEFHPPCSGCGKPFPCQAAQGARIVRAMLERAAGMEHVALAGGEPQDRESQDFGIVLTARTIVDAGAESLEGK